MAGDLYVSWSDYHHTIERLAVSVHDSGWAFNQIVCIARGGLRVGDVMSRIFKLPLAIIFTQSYVDEGGTVRGQITLSEHLSMTARALGAAVLLVDDLVDSGITLEVVKAHLSATHPGIAEMRTAVLWYKACSRLVPDYYADYLADNPWIHQPFEPYDTVSPAELKARLRPG